MSRRVEATIPDGQNRAIQELAKELDTPSLTTLEWTRNKKNLALSPEEFQAVVALIENPPEPNERLRKAAKQCG